jgi:transcriptional regulator with XRE-family HTH domain
MSREGRADEVDKAIGIQIRLRRILLGMNQKQLAALIGVTYQQTHKYEKGFNRVSAGRLWDIAQALGVSIAYFYETVSTQTAVAETESGRMQIELVEHFRTLGRRQQKAIAALVRELTKE